MSKKILRAAALCLALLCALPVGAQAASRRCYVKANTMPVYKQPNQLSNVMGTMSYGEELRWVAWSGNWVQVKNARGQVGYCEKSALRTSNPNTLDMYGWAREGGCRVYSKPDARYRVIARGDAGARVRVVAMTGDGKWVRVKNGSRYGYVRTSELSRSPVEPDSAKQVWIVANSAVNVSRTKGGRSADLGVVSQGQSYLLLKTEGSRAYIRNNKGQQGWVPASAVSRENPNRLNLSVYAQVSGKLLYPNAVRSGAKARVSTGDSLTLVSITEDGSWSRVRRGGKYYYIPSLFVDTSRAPEDGREIECSSAVPVYPTPELSGAPSANLSKGDTARLLGVSGSALHIRTSGGVIGYCQLSDWKLKA